jgi:regulator of sigma E protease
MLDTLHTIISFIVAIGLLVTVHEFGHFWVARRAGVKVLRFSIGFGKPLIKWSSKSGDTEYCIAMIPLGGYVKMLDERDMDVKDEEKHLSFNQQHVAKRIAIVSAGPVFNFIFAVFAYTLVFSSGVEGMRPVIGEVKEDSAAYNAGIRPEQTIVSINNRDVVIWQDTVFNILDALVSDDDLVLVTRDDNQQQYTHIIPAGTVEGFMARQNLLGSLGITPYRIPLAARINQVMPGSPAERAGLQTGDHLLRMDGQNIQSWQDWTEYVQQHPEQTILLEIERGEEIHQLQIRPERKIISENMEIGRVGVSPVIPAERPKAFFAVLQYSAPEAVIVAIEKTWRVSVLTLQMLWKMLIGQASVENISGPISIAQYAGVSAAIGIGQFLSFLAIVSISLGVLNLLPIPLLDGGHLLYYAAEIVKGKPLSEQAQLAGQKIGLVLLTGLMILAVYNDVVRLLNN